MKNAALFVMKPFAEIFRYGQAEIDHLRRKGKNSIMGAEVSALLSGSAGLVCSYFIDLPHFASG